MNPTSASRRNVPSARVPVKALAADRRSPPPRPTRHASQGTSKLVASGPTQTCWREIMRRPPLSPDTLGERTPDPAPSRAPTAYDEPVAVAAADETDLRTRREEASHLRSFESGAEGRLPRLVVVETSLAERCETRRSGGEPDDGRRICSPGRDHAAARASCWGARSANFANRLRKASFSVPIGLLRCLARMISASPWSSDCSL